MAAPPADPRTTPSRLRPVVRLLIALALLDLIVAAFRDTWERYSPDDYAERVWGCAARPREFVLAGGSPVSEGLIPEVVAGFRWHGEGLTDGYVLGLPGATTAETYHAVKHGCPTPPRVLVYGITATDLNDGRREPHGPYSLMTRHDVVDWVRDRPESAEWVCRHYAQGRLSRVWSLFRHRHGIRMWAAATAERQFPGCCPEAAREAADNLRYSTLLRGGTGYAPASGFVAGRYDVAKATGQKLSPFAFLDNYRTGGHLAYLHKLAGWAAERGTTLVLIDMPVTADLEARYPAPFAEYRRRLAEVERDRRLPVLRASREAVGLDDTLFADVIHLNADGARTLSAWVRARLDELGHRPGGRP